MRIRQRQFRVDLAEVKAKVKTTGKIIPYNYLTHRTKNGYPCKTRTTLCNVTNFVTKMVVFVTDTVDRPGTEHGKPFDLLNLPHFHSEYLPDYLDWFKSAARTASRQLLHIAYAMEAWRSRRRTFSMMSPIQRKRG